MMSVENITVLHNHFSACGYQMMEYHVPVAIPALEQLAFSIAEHLEQISDFLKAIKQCIPAPNAYGERRFCYLLEGTEAQQRTVKTMTTRFYLCGLLCNYTIDQHMIKGTVTPLPRPMRFLTGQWLEIYASCIIREAVKTYAEAHDLPYSILSNVKLTKGKIIAYEIDCCFSIGETVFATEQKGGNFHDYLHLHQIGKELGIVPDHYLLLQASLSDVQQADVLEYCYEFYICNLKTFSQKLNTMLTQAA